MLSKKEVVHRLHKIDNLMEKTAFELCWLRDYIGDEDQRRKLATALDILRDLNDKLTDFVEVEGYDESLD